MESKAVRGLTGLQLSQSVGPQREQTAVYAISKCSVF